MPILPKLKSEVKIATPWGIVLHFLKSGGNNNVAPPPPHPLHLALWFNMHSHGVGNIIIYIATTKNIKFFQSDNFLI